MPRGVYERRARRVVPWKQLRGEEEHPNDPALRHIKLTQGLAALVDADDCQRLMSYNWFAHTCRQRPTYAATSVVMPSGKRVRISMHHMILNCKEPVLHRNGNKLDNRKSNLSLRKPIRAISELG